MSSHRLVEPASVGEGFASSENHLLGFKLQNGSCLLEMPTGIAMSGIHDRGHLSNLELFLRFKLFDQLKGL